jgi:hypothetical protein
MVNGKNSKSPMVVESIREYLNFRRTETVSLANLSEPNAWFGEVCDKAIFENCDHVMRAISHALGDERHAPIILMTCNHGSTKYYLSYVLRPDKKQERTYFDFLSGDTSGIDTNIDKYAKDTKLDMQDALRKPRIGHWLLGEDIDRVPMAVFVQLSQRSPGWRVNFSSKQTPLMFTICASKEANGRNELINDFEREPRVSCQQIKHNLENLQQIFDSKPDVDAKNPMGSIIKSSVNLPVHGFPTINLQIWTRRQMTFAADTNSFATKDDRLPLTLDQLMALRLCAERVQGLVAYSLKALNLGR